MLFVPLRDARSILTCLVISVMYISFGALMLLINFIDTAYGSYYICALVQIISPIFSIVDPLVRSNSVSTSYQLDSHTRSRDLFVVKNRQNRLLDHMVVS